MKVLWFAVTPSLYDINNTGHNGGGWISSLESLVRRVPDIELAIAFEHTDSQFKVERDGVTYYPINVWESKLNRLKRKFIYETEEELLVPACKKIVHDYQPDVIHVFGSEWSFGLIAQHTSIPVIIHLQGSIPPYYNARFPVGYNELDFIRYNGLNVLKSINNLLEHREFKKRALREERILRKCMLYMGRTEWDRNLVRLYNPKSEYFHCDEALRSSFFESVEQWIPNERDQIVICSTISSPLYKGADTILKTAQLLKSNNVCNFAWHVFGVKNFNFHEWKTGIKASEVGIKLLGTLSEHKLKSELLSADIFVHPSYIDNSPNSVCEAQLLGMPVIATNVGGISSLVTHEVTGLLVPANDPFTIAGYISRLIEDKQLSCDLGKNARNVALIRHNPEAILTDLLAIYENLSKL